MKATYGLIQLNDIMKVYDGAPAALRFIVRSISSSRWNNDGRLLYSVQILSAALQITTTATSNIGLGANAVDSITTGDYNVGLGDNAGTANH